MAKKAQEPENEKGADSLWGKRDANIDEDSCKHTHEWRRGWASSFLHSEQEKKCLRTDGNFTKNFLLIARISNEAN